MPLTETEQLAAEFQKLGTNARERIEAVQNFLTAQGAAELNGSLVTAKQIEGVEKLMASFRKAPAAASAPASTSQPASGPQRVTDEMWAKMGPAARLDYARQFDQSKF
jgi:hypothetical protein